MKKPVNVLVLTYWSLPDALVQTYTLPYLRIIRENLPPGSSLYLLTLEKTTEAASKKWGEDLQQTGITWLPRRYYPFGFKAIAHWGILLLELCLHIRKNHIQYIHSWATPAGSAGYMLSVLTGTSLIIDSYEPHAEAMVENGTWRRNSFAFRFLFLFERLQTKRAKFLVAANKGMRGYALEKYGAKLPHLLVKPACVNLELFKASEKDVALMKEMDLTGKVVCVYAGKLGGIYLDQEVFDFLSEAHHYWKDRFRVLLLTSHTEEEINRYCRTSQLDRSVVLVRFVPHHEIPRYLSVADFALTPVKPVPTKRFCTPIKDGEYWAMGLPVVITDGISDDSEIIRTEAIGAVLDQLDSVGYRKAIVSIDRLLGMPQQELKAKIREVASRYRSFDIANRVYEQLYGD